MKQKIMNRLRSAEGFTIIEVAISMALTLFILQGIAMVSLYAQKSTIHARRVTSATIIAEQFMEFYRNMDYDNLTDATDNVCFDKDMEQVAACTDSEAIFTLARAFSVNPVIGGVTYAGITQVSLTISWEESWSWSAQQESGTQSVQLVSLIADEF